MIDKVGIHTFTTMKQDSLSYYLKLIIPVADKRNYIKAKHLGETALKKISSLSHTAQEEYQLCYELGMAYWGLTEHSHSLDVFYKAYSIALKHNLGPAYTAYATAHIGYVLVATKNINGALQQLHKFEAYFQSQGDSVLRRDRIQFINVLIALGYCYLRKNETDKVREIIEIRLPEQYTKYKTDSMGEMDYYHLKGEYLMAIRNYEEARKSFERSIKLSEAISLSAGTLESKIHLAVVDLLEINMQSAIDTLKSIWRDSLRLNYRYLICESGLLLSKCYTLKNQPGRAASVEKRLKPILKTVDVGWLYELMKELEDLYRQIAADIHKEFPGDNRMPQSLNKAIKDYYETSSFKHIIIGESKPMQDVYHLLEKIAPTDLPVLIQGETGTGKELIAHAIHQNSNRNSQAYVAFNCGALPETLLESELFGHIKGSFTGAYQDKKGYIELASEGTLFIDEISNMAVSMQQKLLRILEDKQAWRVGAEKSIPVNTRFIFASNRNVEQLVKNRLFREDLYYRINVIVVNLPPLRERKEDIPFLTEHFIRKYAAGGGQALPQISPLAMKMLTEYYWPGNVRELENEIKRICVINGNVGMIDETMLSEIVRTHQSGNHRNRIAKMAGNASLEDMEKVFITETLRLFKGNITRTAKQLGFTAYGLSKKLKRLGINASDAQQS